MPVRKSSATVGAPKSSFFCHMQGRPSGLRELGRGLMATAHRVLLTGPIVRVLPEQFQAELNLPGVAGRCDLAKVGVTHGAVGIHELSMVPSIEKLASEL